VGFELRPFDTIILGAGPAGCVLAARLSEDPGRSVCLVEAGPDYGPRSAGRWPQELLDPTAIPDSHDWRDAGDSLPWARVLGGCSAHNACAVTRGAAAEYESWRAAGGAAWAWRTLEPCLDRARAALAARRPDRTHAGAWHAAVLDAALAAGLPYLPDLDLERVGAGLVAANVVDGARHNAAFAYLDGARQRPNLSVLGDTLVDRVVLDRAGRATGALVRTHGGERTISGGRIILTAGAYGSPAILLRSGIGPPDELRRHGIRVRHELRGVGTDLADHCRAGIGFRLRPAAHAAMRAEHGHRAIVAQCIAKWASSRDVQGAWDIHLLAIVPPDRSSGRITAGLVAPRSRGRLRLRSSDPARLPLVEPGFLSDEAGDDLAALTEGLQLARALAAEQPLERLVAGEIDPGAEVDAAAHAAATVTTYYHPSGTCRLGPADDPYAVVDAAAAVHGVENLHVADASVIPAPVRAGTHLTTLAVAERVAEILRGAA
jgi:choline dehydrogenase